MTKEHNEVPCATTDFATEAASQLAELFPEIVADGKINLDTLKTILDIDIEDGHERFGLTWPGKREAIRAAQTPTTATLIPDKQNSIDWDTTQNVFIEGDNLEVLKILQKHYYGKIKMIYIDPPYNTGNDFVYSDNYADSIGNYLEITGQTDDGGKLSTNSESDGRFHSNWLNMMYPRLKLARNLLTADGAIFVSISDHEVDNLKKIICEIFGEYNFVGQIAVAKGTTTGQDANDIGSSIDFLLVAARNKNEFSFNGLPLTESDKKRFNQRDEKGQYSVLQFRKTGSNDRREDRPNLYYPLVSPDGTEVYPVGPSGYESCWRASLGQFQQWDQDGMVVWKVGDDGNWKPYIKYYLEERTKQVSNYWDDIEGNKKATLTVTALMGSKVFDNPKPVGLLRKCLFIQTDASSIVLDFFAGSGTTAHAAMALNAEDGGNRRCISVQLPEPTDEKSEARKAGYENIAEITRERIRRAGAKILEEESAKLDGHAEGLDVGFRAYKLVDTNFTKWRAHSSLSEEELKGLFAGMGESADDDARPEALLTEVLLKLGFSLTEQVERVDVAGLEAFSVAGGLVVAYLNEHVEPTLEQLRAMVALEPGRLVVLEDAFQGDDVLKTNLVQECRSHGVDLWTA